MPTLSWNEIRQRAIQFSRQWEGVTDERAEAQSFWNDFFQVFGIQRREVAIFERRVRSISNTYHRIDLFWPGTLLAEHKSAGADLSKAESQAFRYIEELIASGHRDECPQYVILSDFNRIVLYNLEPEPGQSERIEIRLEELHAHVTLFAFFIGQQTHNFGEEDPANLQAAEIMAGLHDAVADDRYDPHSLERLLVRLLFCLFAEGTGIFSRSQFQLYIENRTREDGSDLGLHLNALFEVLDTPEDRRSPRLDEDIAAFPYINGQLFADHLPTAAFDRAMRDRLLAASRFDWSRISPAIFGSLFQGIMDAKERRQIGAHYTSERDILKLIRPLFLDELRAEFDRIAELKQANRRERELTAFQQKLASLKFLDPACGCGNFLVIAYRELRRLEMDALRLLTDNFHGGQQSISAEEVKLSLVDVHQFYGIEIGEWPARIAETALWLVDHQMNVELSRATGNLFQRIPLKSSPHILCANSLRVDWNDLLPANECSYVMGNPPFVGAKYQTKEQRDDVKHIASNVPNAGLLDYVTLWYFKAADYIKNTKTRCSFVSTNSITQGEQVGVLWPALFKRDVKIHFGHRTFSWQSEAKGKAHVHVVIIGFGLFDIENKRIFEYEDIKGEPTEVPVSNIAPYLVEGGDIAIQNRSKPLSKAPEMSFGNQPIDGGNLILDAEEAESLISTYPEAKPYIRKYIGSRELINGMERWCLWLRNAPPEILRNCSQIHDRIVAVRKFRQESKREVTQNLAATSYLFAFISHQEVSYLAIPSVSSERREYIPIGFMPSDVIASNLCLTISNATPFHFGVLTSAMHMAWVRQVCGRLESRYRYSAKLVYNNFPWPTDATAGQKAKVESCAQAVLDARQPFLDSGATLADLYDPLTMPAPLLKAHQALDRAVDRCYRAQPFQTERERVEFLFRLYEEITSPLAPSAAPRPRKRTRKKA